MELFELIELLDEDIISPKADMMEANKVFQSVDRKLQKAGFITKNGKVFNHLLDAVWKQCEKDYHHLL